MKCLSYSEYARLQILCYQWIHLHEKNSQWCETLMGCFHQQSNETSLPDENTPLWVPAVFSPILLPHDARNTSNHGCVNILMYCDNHLLFTDKCVCTSPDSEDNKDGAAASGNDDRATERQWDACALPREVERHASCVDDNGGKAARPH